MYLSFPWIIVKIRDSFREFSIFSVSAVLALQSLLGSDSSYGSRGQNHLRWENCWVFKQKEKLSSNSGKGLLSSRGSTLFRFCAVTGATLFPHQFPNLSLQKTQRSCDSTRIVILQSLDSNTGPGFHIHWPGSYKTQEAPLGQFRKLFGPLTRVLVDNPMCWAAHLLCFLCRAAKASSPLAMLSVCVSIILKFLSFQDISIPLFFLSFKSNQIKYFILKPFLDKRP